MCVPLRHVGLGEQTCYTQSVIEVMKGEEENQADERAVETIRPQQAAASTSATCSASQALIALRLG